MGEVHVEHLSDSVTIYHADCMDVLPVECDAVVTDPPYGIGFGAIIMIVIPTQREARDALTYLVESSSQRAVAEVLGVHYNTIYRWLHGDDIPRVAVLAVMWLTMKNMEK